ncbi:MAG: DUF1273 family protein [Oscillospiraceae bacterium]|nr:DUF1273 family protein [Oscillospiraceae bacterium]
MKNRSCFFIGEKTFLPKNDPGASGNLKIILFILAESGFTDFYAGGDLGWDLFCEWSVLGLKNQYPEIGLHLILPSPLEQHTAGMDNTLKATYDVIADNSESVEIIPDTGSRLSRFTELADMCICCFDKKDPRSETAKTVLKIQSAGKIILNMYNFSKE